MEDNARVQINRFGVPFTVGDVDGRAIKCHCSHVHYKSLDRWGSYLTKESIRQLLGAIFSRKPLRRRHTLCTVSQDTIWSSRSCRRQCRIGLVCASLS